MNTRKRQPMQMSSPLTSNPDSTGCSTSKVTSTERVRKFRLKHKEADGYDHEQTKEETRERIAAIRAR